MSRILVVDDEKDIGLIMQLMLTSVGHEVFFATTTEEAREKMKESLFDTVFLDLNLNGEIGLSLLPDIRRRSNQTQVIVITAQKDPHIRQMVLEEGIQILIDKPFTKRQILEVLKL